VLHPSRKRFCKQS